MNLVESIIIHKALFDRWAKLNLSAADVIRDATARGLKGLTHSRMSKYKTRGSKETVSDQQLRWLLVRYAIPFFWDIGTPKVIEGKLKFVIPEYDELECLKNLQKIYGGQIVDVPKKKVKEEKPKKEKK